MTYTDFYIEVLHGGLLVDPFLLISSRLVRRGPLYRDLHSSVGKLLHVFETSVGLATQEGAYKIETFPTMEHWALKPSKISFVTSISTALSPKPSLLPCSQQP